MTRSLLDGEAGWQRPRVEWVPDGDPHPDAQDILDLAEAAGLPLDPWQQAAIEKSTRRRNGKWAAFEVAAVAPRQNGKNAILEARQLGGLFVLRERLQIHSSHQVDTSLEAFRRLKFLIESNDWLMAEGVKFRNTNGQEEIEVPKYGTRIRFRTRTKGGGRGFSGDAVYFDEAMIFPEASLGAIMPVVSAKSVKGDPQLWYTGSAVDQTIHEDGLVLARLRRRALNGGDPSLCYMEWSIAGDRPDDVTFETATSEIAWKQANPALNVRISADHVANEQRSMDPRTFAVERLGVGDWPSPDGANLLVDLAAWHECCVRGDLSAAANQIHQGPVVFAFDVAPDRAWSTLSVGGKRPDGLPHFETVDRRRGTGWLLPEIVDRVHRNQVTAVLLDAAGPAGALLPELQQQKLGVPVVTVTAPEHAKACGMLVDRVLQRTVRHLGTPELEAALKGAVSRPLGEAWAWSRKNSTVDITPIVAGTLALWGVMSVEATTAWVGW